MRNKRRKISLLMVFVLALSLIINTIVSNEVMALSNGTSQETEKELKSIINKYGDENIIYKNAIALNLGQTIMVSDLVDEINDEMVFISNNEDIITIEEGKIIANKGGTTFIIVKNNDKFQVQEVYVDAPLMKMSTFSAVETAVIRDKYLVYIDAGHGGSDPGARANGIDEKTINLTTALKVRDKLKALGVDVVMNRETDVFVDFRDTAAHANRVNPDAFVSIHHNATTNTSVNGIESFYTKDIDIPLGKEVHNKLISNTGANNRGLKKDLYYVTNNTKMAAVLVEGGFLTNAAEAAKLKTESYQQAIVNAIVDGTMTYLKNNITLKPAKPLTATRIFGQTRYETSYELFKKGWETSDTVILTTGGDYPDALASAPLAGKYDAPILLMKNTALDNQLELVQLLINKGVKNAILIGETGVIPSGTESELSAMGITSKRIGGKNRYETAVKIAYELDSNTGEVAIAYGLGYADGLSISAVAAIKGMPVLLTETNALPEVVKEYINNKGIIKSYIAGSQSVVSSNVATELGVFERLGGSNRFETNSTIFNRFKYELNLNDIYIASGMDFPDALSATALAAKNNTFVLLSNQQVAYENIKNILVDNREAINSVYVLGSNKVIPDKVLYDLSITNIN